jgi:hypothetical protein
MTEIATRLQCADQSITLGQVAPVSMALGPATVTVSAGGLSYTASISTLLTYGGLKVSALPDILLSASLPDGIRGYPYAGTISATNIGGATGAITITVDSLPAGLALGETTTDDGVTYTATITGTLQ